MSLRSMSCWVMMMVVMRPVWGVQVGQAAQGAAPVSNQVEMMTPAVHAAVQVVAACKRSDPVGLLWLRIVQHNLDPNPLPMAFFSFFLIFSLFFIYFYSPKLSKIG